LTEGGGKSVVPNQMKCRSCEKGDGETNGTPTDMHITIIWGLPKKNKKPLKDHWQPQLEVLTLQSGVLGGEEKYGVKEVNIWVIKPSAFGKSGGKRSHSNWVW